MSLLWMDGFDHYGAGADGPLAMLDGVYAEVDNNLTTAVTHARTGTYSAVCGSGAGQAGSMRRIFGEAKASAGVGFALWPEEIPAINDSCYLVAFCDTGNVGQVIFILQSTGKVSAYRCTGTNVAIGTLLAESADGAIVASAFQHFEAAVTVSQTAGTVEARVNGVTVLSASGLDTAATANVETSQVRVHGRLGASTVVMHIDDLFAWDTAGAQNNYFLGDRRVRTFFPNADTAVADWSLTGAAAGYDCINDAAPDEDTTYLSAVPLVGSPVTPLVSEFGLENPPSTIGAVAAVQTYVRARKTQAGDGDMQVSMLSGSSASAGADRPLTEQYTYWTDVHELNPDTGTPWNESSLTSAKIRLSRTA